MGIKPGDRIRCPDRAIARWHQVQRVGRRRDGTRYVVIRRSRFWRALGLSPRQVLEWSMLRAIGCGLKRARPAMIKIEVQAADAQLLGLLPPRGWLR